MDSLIKQNIIQTKKDIKNAMSQDNLIIQTIHSITELRKCISRLTANLRERYGLYSPLTAKKKETEEFLTAMEKQKQGEMGMNLTKEDLISITEITKNIYTLNKTLTNQENYLRKTMEKICPNLLELTEPIMGAQLVDKAGSLKRLAELPSSTIQVLGAEKALFRHIKSKTKAPKFGIIFSHPSIISSKNKGKAARQLASKISLAIKKDYFKEK